MTRNVDDRHTDAPTILVEDDFYSTAFSFYSHISGAVDPRTGMYSASIDLPVGKGNRLRGPGFGFRLRYSPLSHVDHGFGEGWLLGMTELDLDTHILTLDSGDTHRIDWLFPGDAASFPDRKLESFRLTPGAGMASATLEHATGVVEHLEKMQHGPSAMRTVRMVSPAGDALHSAWTLGPNGTVVLASVTDDEGTLLLGIDYPDRAEVRLRIATGVAEPLEIVFERLGKNLQRVRIPAIVRLNEGSTLAEEEPVWAFGYRDTLDPPYLSLLESIDSPDGIHEEVRYDEHALPLPRGAPRPYMPAVAARTRTLSASPIARADTRRAPRTHFVQASTYRYDDHGYANFYGYPVVPNWQDREDQLLRHMGGDDFRYGSTETQRDEEGAALCSIRREYDHFHLIREETTQRGSVVQQVTTAYGSLPGRSFDDQPVAFQLPHAITTTVYDTRDEAMKQVTVNRSVYDAHGNVQSRLDTASGIEEQSVYYPLEGETGLCPADPLRMVRRLKSTTALPGPGGGPKLTTHYRYAALPARATSGADKIYIQAVAEWTTLDETGQTLSESRQAFIVDQGEQHGALARETHTVEGQTHTRELSYLSDTRNVADRALDALILRTTDTTPDGIVSVTEEVLSLVGGFVLETTDMAGNKTGRAYDSLGRLSEEVQLRDGIDPCFANRWVYRLTRAERSVTRIGSTGLVHRQWLDEHGRLIAREEPLPDGGTMVVGETVYDTFGDVVESTIFDRLADGRQLALAMHYTYDDWGRPADTASPDGSHTRTQTSLIAWSGEVMSHIITWQEADGARIGGWRSVDEDIAGHQRRVQTGRWDTDGNPLACTSETRRYDGLGRCIETSDAMGRVTQQQWDHLDRPTQTLLPDGSVVTRTYATGQTDQLLACLAVTPPGETAPIILGTRHYDGLARLTHETSGSLAWTFSYVQGQISPASEERPDGAVIDRTYDAWLGEALLTETLRGALPHVLKQATYSPVTGMPATLGSDAGAMLIRTDYLGRMTEQDIVTGGTVSRSTCTTLSPGGLEQAKTGVDGMRRVFIYDDAGRIARTTDCDAAGALVVEVSFAYDAISRPCSRTSRDAHGAVIETVTYDDLGRLDRTTWTHEGRETTNRRSLALVWREDGKLIGKHWHDGSDTLYRNESMDYDVRGRLICHAISSSTGDFPVDNDGRPFEHQNFSYDCLDNLMAVDTTFVDGGAEATCYEHDPVDRDRVIAIVTTATEHGVSRQDRVVMRYDQAGRLVEDGLGGCFGWDGAGRLAFTSQKNGCRRDYRYGPDGRIASVESSRGTTAYRYYDDGRLYGEFSGDDERRYVRVGDVAIAETVLSHAVRSTWLLATDPQGSVVMEASDETRWRTYGAYGERDTAGDGAHGGFAGEISEDETGCYLLGGRLYSPRLRRFLSPDHASPFDAGGLNRYAYCGGDPINRVDPTGESWQDWLRWGGWAGVAASIVGAVAATVVTAGAFAGVAAAAVAGSLAGAVVTPGMMVMATATVLEVATAAVDLAANIAVETGEDRAAGILGWLAAGTAVAAAGAAGGALWSAQVAGRAGLRTSRRFVGRSLPKGAARSPPSLVGSKYYPDAPDPASFKETWRHPGGQVVKVYQGQAATNKVPHRVNAPGNGISVIWQVRRNRAGGYVYAADTTIDNWDVSDLVDNILTARGDNKPILIKGGVHGNSNGHNYTTTGHRAGANSKFSAEDEEIAAWHQPYTTRNIDVVDISHKSKAELASYAQKNAHVIEGFCHSAADPVVMEAMNLNSVKVFRM
jgi:RHS repeat-associated protein